MNFEEYWSDLRKGFKPSVEPNSIDLVSLNVVHRWTQDQNPLRPSFVVVSGADRDRLYQRVQDEDWLFDERGAIHDLNNPHARDWVNEGVGRHLVHRVRALEIPPEFRDRTGFRLAVPGRDEMSWEILWGLVATVYPTIEDPLSSLVDKRHSLYFDAHRALLEARLESLDSRDPTVVIGAVQTIGKWIEGQRHSNLSGGEQAFLVRARLNQAVTDPERFDVLQFCLALAKQNQVIGGVTLALDGLENLTSTDRAEELYRILDTADKWVSLGSPLGLVLGWRGSKEDAKALRKLHPKLARRIIDSDRWIRQASSVEEW